MRPFECHVVNFEKKNMKTESRELHAVPSRIRKKNLYVNNRL